MMETAAQNTSGMFGHAAVPAAFAVAADQQLRLSALQLAVEAHKAGDYKTSIVAKTVDFYVFLKTGAFPE